MNASVCGVGSLVRFLWVGIHTLLTVPTPFASYAFHPVDAFSLHTVPSLRIPVLSSSRVALESLSARQSLGHIGMPNRLPAHSTPILIFTCFSSLTQQRRKSPTGTGGPRRRGAYEVPCILRVKELVTVSRRNEPWNPR